MVEELKPDKVLLDGSLIDQNTEYLQWNTECPSTHQGDCRGDLRESLRSV